MNAVKAFVGHSFRKEDQHLVGSILQCLKRVNQLHPNFTWEHAQEPEPEMVHDKVLSMFQDKNLFIGICTKYEKTILETELEKRWYFGGKLAAEASSFEWKTSDWLLQEIGFSVGRGLKIIILLEEGVRPPGSLQGNLEYILFSRDSPEKAYDKLLGMLVPIITSAKLIEPTSGQEAQGPVAIPEKTEMPSPTSPGNDWRAPKQDWSAEKYRLAYFQAIREGDDACAESIWSQFRCSDCGARENERLTFAAWVECVKIMMGKGGSINKLETLIQSQTPTHTALSYLASSYSFFDEHNMAAKIYARAADIADNAGEKINYLADAITSLLKADRADDATKLEAAMSSINIDTIDNRILLIKRKIYICEEKKDNETLVALLEHLLEIAPDDKQMRFKLAYKYSELKKTNLSLFHYLRILPRSRTGTEWNNIGVALDEVGAATKAVSAYREAEQQGETLAMSNLANKLLGAGFLSEAEMLLEKATKIPDYHRNIDANTARVKEIIDEDNEKQESTVRAARPNSEFYRKLGEALLSSQIKSIASRWKSPNCELQVSIKEDSFEAIGIYEESLLGMSLANLNRNLGSRDNAPLRKMEHYKGTIKGRAIIGFVSRQRADGASASTSTLLTNYDESPLIAMWLTDDGNTLIAQETSEPNAARIYLLRQIN